MQKIESTLVRFFFAFLPIVHAMWILDEFFNHKFLHQTASNVSPAKRILEQHTLSPTHVRRVPSAVEQVAATANAFAYAPPMHRVGSEQSHQLYPGAVPSSSPASGVAIAPASAAAVGHSNMARRRSENVHTPRSLLTRVQSEATAPAAEHIRQQPTPPSTSSALRSPRDTPLRPQKSAPAANQALTESGDFTFLPPLNPLAAPQLMPSTSQQNSPRNLYASSQASNESAVKQVQVHSSSSSGKSALNVSSSALKTRAVPVGVMRKIALTIVNFPGAEYAAGDGKNFGECRTRLRSFKSARAR